MSGPWYITPQAVRDYLQIRGWADDVENFATGQILQEDKNASIYF
jgi:hypothetical protein